MASALGSLATQTESDGREMSDNFVAEKKKTVKQNATASFIFTIVEQSVLCQELSCLHSSRWRLL